LQVEVFRVDPAFDGKSLVRVILGRYPSLSAARVFQALRRKDIRLNGKRQHADAPVHAGDEVTLYISGDLSETDNAAGTSSPGGKPGMSSSYYSVVFQDPLILIVAKKPGIAVQPGESGKAGRLPEPDLLSVIRLDFNEPAIELCHRLDRQTGGLLVLSRKPAGLAAVREMMMSGQIIKRYRCLVRGTPTAGEAVLSHDGLPMLEMAAWLEKDAGQSLVYVHDQKQPGDLPIITRYRILEVYKNAGPDEEDVSLLEVELPTGRTHQIRAHFAHIGHPLLGDGKYGLNVYNRFLKGRRGSISRQQLVASQILFLPDIKGPLAYLAGRTFSIEPEFDWQPPV
jgi:23S rRNA pseudouridine955/2504/2580 synthase